MTADWPTGADARAMPSWATTLARRTLYGGRQDTHHVYDVDHPSARVVRATAPGGARDREACAGKAQRPRSVPPGQDEDARALWARASRVPCGCAQGQWPARPGPGGLGGWGGVAAGGAGYQCNLGRGHRIGWRYRTASGCHAHRDGRAWARSGVRCWDENCWMPSSYKTARWPRPRQCW